MMSNVMSGGASVGYILMAVLMATMMNISCTNKNRSPARQDQVTQEPPQRPPDLSNKGGKNEERPKVRPNRDPRLVEVVDILWESPLGRTFFAYMYGSPPEDATSRQVVDRVLSDGGKSVTKISALQLLIEELYDNDLMGDEQRRKLDIFRGDMLQRQADLATHPTENIAYIASTAFLSLVPLGYPPVRHALLKLAARIPEWSKTQSLRKLTQNVPPLSVGARTYDIKWVIGTFFKYFGPFSFLYFFWFDWKESTRGHSIPYNIETITSEETYQEFLRDIRDL